MYFISDTHFHHANIIKLAGRPFASVQEMNEEMVSRWNAVVRPDDIVWHLGDFAYGTWKGGDTAAIFARLNGRKHLVKGNHDHDETLNLGWERVVPYHVIKYNHKKIILSHYPILEWDGCFHGTLHFHGHTHNKSPLEIMEREVFLVKATKVNFPSVEDSRFTKYYNNWRNISAEMINYTPQHIDELIKDKE